MDNAFSAADIEFQQEVREFFNLEFTPDLKARAQDGSDVKGVAVEWQRKLYEKGWMVGDCPEIGQLVCIKVRYYYYRRLQWQ